MAEDDPLYLCGSRGRQALHCRYADVRSILTMGFFCSPGSTTEPPPDPPTTTAAASTVDGDDCDPNPCRHAGTCTDEGDTFSCACTAEWEGTICAKAVVASTTPAGKVQDTTTTADQERNPNEEGKVTGGTGAKGPKAGKAPKVGKMDTGKQGKEGKGTLTCN